MWTIISQKFPPRSFNIQRQISCTNSSDNLNDLHLFCSQIMFVHHCWQWPKTSHKRRWVMLHLAVSDQVNDCLEGSATGWALVICWEWSQNVDSGLAQFTFFFMLLCNPILLTGAGTSVGAATSGRTFLGLHSPSVRFGLETFPLAIHTWKSITLECWVELCCVWF